MSNTRAISARLDPDLIAKVDQLPGATFTERLSYAIAQAPDSDAGRLVEELSGAAIPGTALYAPGSAASERLETYMAAAQAGIAVPFVGASDNIAQHVLTAAQAVNVGEPADGSLTFIDNAIQAMMTLAEFYATEGDIWTALTVPLEVGYQDFDFATGDQGAIREARTYLEDELDMHRRLAQIFLNRRVYGQAYVVEVDPARGPTDLILPNPKHIAVQQHGVLSAVNYNYRATPGEAKSLVAEPPPFFYAPSAPGWNEKEPDMRPFKFKPDAIKVFHEFKHDHNLYALPPLARATRALDSRRYLEDMARATIEGIRNQLWVFTVENPMVGEVPALVNRLTATVSARTGFLVWRSGLEVKQYIPGSVDELLGNETFWEFTLRVFRALGMSVRFVAGENPNRSGSTDAESDIKIGLNRMMYWRGDMQRYMQSLVDRRLGFKAGDARRPMLRFKDIELAIAERVKTLLAPLMDRGLPSPRTAYAMAGLDYDQEVAQHGRDKEFRDEYLKPYTAFAQAGPQSLTEHADKGRPTGVIEKQPRQVAEANVVRASFLGDYTDAIEDVWDELAASYASDASPEEKRKKIAWFVLALIAAGSTYRRSIYGDAYFANGGMGEPNALRIQDVIAWDTANAEAFGEELLSRLEAGADIAGLRQRALLYASQGHKMAFMAGLFQAKMEQGWTHWRRVLRPGLSASGPCEVCVADARNVHPITEAFWDHPRGVCGMIYVQFRHNLDDGPTQVVRIPALTVDD